MMIPLRVGLGGGVLHGTVTLALVGAAAAVAGAPLFIAAAQRAPSAAIVHLHVSSIKPDRVHIVPSEYNKIT